MSIFLICALISIGIVGIFVNCKNVLKLFISMECIFLAVFLNFINFAKDSGEGIIVGIFILSLGATEVAIGLSLMINFFNKKGHLNIDKKTKLMDINDAI